ncbi:MAG TPA: hypothetical protein VJS37_19210 [Terriglobales bacterium]|nr:hypothetical protein [Terriglobales bacterium]
MDAPARFNEEEHASDVIVRQYGQQVKVAVIDAERLMEFVVNLRCSFPTRTDIPHDENAVSCRTRCHHESRLAGDK